MAATILRNEFQQLSRIRLRESRALLLGKEFSGSYYLAGISVECAIKACIAKQVRRYQFPDKELGNNAFKHELLSLVKTASLYQLLEQEWKKHNPFEINWKVVSDWNIESRYQVVAPVLAKDMYRAVTSRRFG